jgi:hypothetical protein
VQVPAIAAGMYGVSVVTSGGSTSDTYAGFELLSGPQVTLRFVVNNAFTVSGENVFLTGDKHELTNWSTAAPLGALFNQVVYTYPTWYTDVSVPAGANISYKFIKKSGGPTVWEGGANHTVVAPASGTGTVNVNWQN